MITIPIGEWVKVKCPHCNKKLIFSIKKETSKNE